MTPLPQVSGRELVRALERGGFVVHRQRGSHVILRRPGGKGGAVVPLHAGKDLPPGTLKSVLQQAGLSVDELVELLNS